MQEYKQKNLFRILFVLITGALLSVCFYSIVRTATSLTDENQFQNPLSRLYIQARFDGTMQEDTSDTQQIIIEVGEQLIAINGKPMVDMHSFYRLFNPIAENDTINLTIFSPKLGNIRPLRVIKSNLPRPFVRYLPSAAIVSAVSKGGASDRAGIRKGDYITKINGRTFKDVSEADRIMRSGRSGGLLTYEILRNNEYLNKEVELVKFGISLIIIIVNIIGLIYLIFAISLVLKKPDLKAVKLISLLMVAFGFTILSSSFDRFISDFDTISIIRLVMKNISVAFIPALYLHSSVYFPQERIELIKKPWLVIIPYIIGLIVFVGGLIFYTTGNSVMANLPIAGLVLCIIYVFVVNQILRRQTSVEYKRMSRAIRYGYIFFMFYIFFLSNFLISLSDTFHWELQNTLKVLQEISFLLIPLVYIYTIGRYRLLDLELRIRRNIQYVIASLLWRSILIALLGTLIWLVADANYYLPNIHFDGSTIEVLKHSLSPERQQFYEKIIVLISTLIAIFIYIKAGRSGQKILDKKFFRASLDYRKVSYDLSRIIMRNAGVEDLSGKILKELLELMPFKSLGIMFFRYEKDIYGQEYHGFKSDSLREYCSLAGQSIVKAFKQFHGEFRVDYLPDVMKGIFSNCGFIYIVPIYSKEKLIGAILAGEKLSEISFRREDLEFLTSVASQASVAIENAFLYEDLAQQERIKHELNLARRIQLASLPSKVPEVSNLDISGVSLPAHEVGGDFYDFLSDQPHDITVVVGDVSGKGTSAALYMAKAQGIMRTLYEFDLSPKQLFVRFNQLLYRYLEKSSFITALGLRFDTNQRILRAARAGHVPLYYYNHNDQKIEKLVPKGIVLGMSNQKLFSGNMDELNINYNPGDVFLMISDGVIEARSHDDQEFGEEMLIDTYSKYVMLSAEDIRSKIVNSVMEFSKGTDQFDDLTVVVVKAV